MDGIFEFFKQIADAYGVTAALSILGIGLLGYYSYFLIKTFPKVIQSVVDKKLKENIDNHKNATKKRKNIIIEVSKVLSASINGVTSAETNCCLASLPNTPFRTINLFKALLRCSCI